MIFLHLVSAKCSFMNNSQFNNGRSISIKHDCRDFINRFA
jgi:hypothetical protein